MNFFHKKNAGKNFPDMDSSGKKYLNNAASGNTQSGNEFSNNAASGNTQSGNEFLNDAASGNTQSGNAFADNASHGKQSSGMKIPGMSALAADFDKSQALQNSKTGRKKRNRQYLFIAYFFTGIFLAMAAYFAYFETVESNSFINSSYNPLQDLAASTVIRGDIVSADGEVLAYTQTDTDGTESRVYPYKNEYAHVVGYNVNGKAGLENLMNFSLLTSHDFFMTRIYNDLADQKNQGDTIVTTLDSSLQDVVYDAMEDYRGAVVAIEPSTGKILCMVSKPDFNPNTVKKNWDDLNAEGSSVLFNRVTLGQYAPGSVFKIFTALEYYRENKDSWTEFSYDCSGSVTEDDYTLHCAGGEEHGSVDLTEAFAESCNCAFSEIGLTLDASRFRNLCDSLLFDTRLPGPFNTAESQFTLSSDDSTETVMQTAIGQGETLVSPMQMCEIASAICNNGTLMTPYITDSIQNENGDVVTSTKASKNRTLFTEDECAFLESLMEAVTDHGTASKLSGQDYDAYGKTGTAQVSDGKENGWFVGYARQDGKEIAVAIIIENSGAGSRYAVPVAKKMFAEYFD